MSDIVGKAVRGVVDRPLGSRHPQYHKMIYPVNYGYVEGVIGGDGEEHLDSDEPLERFEGKVIAVYRRFYDCEEKWIVSLGGTDYSDEEILNAICFQEQYFDGELIR